MQSTISRRTLRVRNGLYERFHHIVFVTSGRATMITSDAGQPMEGPALAHIPPSSPGVVEVGAGAECILIGASPQMIVDAIGDKAESYALRILTEQPFLASEIGRRDLSELNPLFDGFVTELRDPDRGSWMVISAYLRLILMAIWRARGRAGGDQRGQGEVASVLQRYRQLVEVYFRSHRSIADYARELGITTDRLHAICQRTLARSPIQLLHERVVQEAKLRLERSAGTIQQISDGLGFRDPTYFSHFFKRQTGLSPAVYRSLARKPAGLGDLTLSSGYSDWP